MYHVNVILPKLRLARCPAANGHSWRICVDEMALAALAHGGNPAAKGTRDRHVTTALLDGKQMNPLDN